MKQTPQNKGLLGDIRARRQKVAQEEADERERLRNDPTLEDKLGKETDGEGLEGMR